MGHNGFPRSEWEVVRCGLVSTALLCELEGGAFAKRSRMEPPGPREMQSISGTESPKSLCDFWGQARGTLWSPTGIARDTRTSAPRVGRHPAHPSAAAPPCRPRPKAVAQWRGCPPSLFELRRGIRLPSGGGDISPQQEGRIPPRPRPGLASRRSRGSPAEADEGGAPCPGQMGGGSKRR